MSIELLKSGAKSAIGDDIFEEYDKTHSFDINKKPKPNQTLVWCNGSPIGTRGGNIIAISGLAKSRKSVVASSMASGMLLNEGSEYLNFKCRVEPTENILHIDTEQGYYHYYNTVKRIVDNSGGEVKDNFHSKHTRDASVQFRVDYLKYLFDKIKPRVAMIDGITDLVRDPNDAGESSDLISLLMQLTSDHDCLLVVVIHTTKSTSKLRGHLGSELERKCETAIRVEKDEKYPNFSHVMCKESRNKEFEDFTIMYDDLISDYKVLEKEDPIYSVKEESNNDFYISPEEYGKPHHKSVVNKMFKKEIEGMKILSRDQAGLLRDIASYGTGGVKRLSKKCAKKWLSYYEEKCWLYCNQLNNSKWEKTELIDLDESNTIEIFNKESDLPF